ncbi:hypothetical protein [Staphylococcus haemolyticus]|uniref:hypothetical protein n=1 Tax=Staphylococcus haemolyticus TaxID=1283 RepID=UPI0034DD366C
MQVLEMEKTHSELPDEHLAVLQVIENAPDKYITKEKVIVKLGKPQSYTRKLSKLIAELRNFYGVPIGCGRDNNKGYFIMKNEADRLETLHTLESLNGGISRSIESVKNFKFN